ncbi:MAG: hypothetical protein KC877_05295, partial [Candidatus Kaiserbacteria bacterium]|nr:hypothetical protein [Candidatus Kaiserbacteria bacterium]
MSQSNVAPIAPPIQSWSLDPITATRATAGDLMALIAHMDGKVSVIPIEGGTNVAIFAEDPIAAVKLANW